MCNSQCPPSYGKFRNSKQGRNLRCSAELDRLEAATSLRDLAALRGNRFEALLGDRKGQYGIRINDQWRVCVEWLDRSPGPSEFYPLRHTLLSRQKLIPRPISVDDLFGETARVLGITE